MPYLLLVIIFSIINLGVGVTVPVMTAIVMQAAGPSHVNMDGVTLNVNLHQIITRLVGVPPTKREFHTLSKVFKRKSHFSEHVRVI